MPFCHREDCARPATFRILQPGQPTATRCDVHVRETYLALLDATLKQPAHQRESIILLTVPLVCELCGKPVDEPGDLHRECMDAEQARDQLEPVAVTWSGLVPVGPPA